MRGNPSRLVMDYWSVIQYFHFHLQTLTKIKWMRFSNRSDIVCQQASSHGYNTRSKAKMTNPVQRGDPHLKPNQGQTNSEVNPNQGQSKARVKPSQGHSKKVEQNAGGLSYTPTELHKRQLEDADIGPVLQWKESDNRPFGKEICSASAATQALLELPGPARG